MGITSALVHVALHPERRERAETTADKDCPSPPLPPLSKNEEGPESPEVSIGCRDHGDSIGVAAGGDRILRYELQRTGVYDYDLRGAPEDAVPTGTTRATDGGSLLVNLETCTYT